MAAAYMAGPIMEALQLIMEVAFGPMVLAATVYMARPQITVRVLLLEAIFRPIAMRSACGSCDDAWIIREMKREVKR